MYYFINNLIDDGPEEQSDGSGDDFTTSTKKTNIYTKTLEC
jgi:hypothetical protein